MRHPAVRSQSNESKAVTRLIGARLIGWVVLPLALGLAGCNTEIEPTQLSDDLAAVTAVAQAVASATGITGGENHSCAIRPDATVVCWGRNQEGQLGDGTHTRRLAPVPVVGLSNVVSVAAGRFHTCAIRTDGTGRCWGSGSFGQLGNGSTTNRSVPVVVSGITTGSRIATGGNYSCTLLANDTARCWGWNISGQLGDGTFTSRSAPVQVANYP